MIYKGGYFEKEMRQASDSNKAARSAKAAFAIFTGLLSFAAFFVLQTLKESVLSEAVPQIMQQSYFSTLYLYIHAALILHTAYFIIYFDSLFLTETRSSAWYLLVHMGHRPLSMFYSKLLALLLSVFAIYLTGFAAVLFLTMFLKYTFIFAYIPALFFAGFVDIALMLFLSMTISLYAKSSETGRCLIAASAVLLLALKAGMGFYTILSDRVLMQDFASLLHMSAFLPVAAVILAACFIACLLGAIKAAGRYGACRHGGDLPPGAEVVRIDPGSGSILRESQRKWAARSRKLFRAAVTVLLAVLIGLALIINVCIIILSTSTPGDEVTIRGVIPYLFQSDTMQPAIMLNDLAFFKRVDTVAPVKTGQIVLLRQNNTVFVERIVEMDADSITVDIDYYPPLAEKGVMVRIIKRHDIYGVYTGRSRWLGALILFANTITGRIVLLLVPVVLLFYRKHMFKWVRKRSAEHQ